MTSCRATCALRESSRFRALPFGKGEGEIARMMKGDYGEDGRYPQVY